MNTAASIMGFLLTLGIVLIVASYRPYADLRDLLFWTGAVLVVLGGSMLGLATRGPESDSN